MPRYAATEADVGARLDVFLAAAAGATRAQVQRWIEAGRVHVNARAARSAQRIEAGDEIVAEPPEPEPSGVAPEATPLAVLHEDADVIVIDKPAGLVVHPSPGHASGTLVNALLHHCPDLSGIGGVRRPGIVHRLDRGTSGVLVVAKHDAAHEALSRQFRDHSIERVYLALVRGMPSAEEGFVDRAIGRHRTDRKRMSVRTHHGREARTRWRVRERFRRSGCMLLEVRPETGRTHQIRVHLASAGMPIVGDPVYGGGGGPCSLERPALHAAVLGFTHPGTGERVRFESPLPPDLAECLRLLADREEGT